MHPYRMLTAILVLCSLSAPARPTAQSARIDEQPSFRSGVELVSVDVAVLDKERRPIQGLRAADFTVTVGGEPRRVVTADFVDAAAQSAQSKLPDSLPISTNEATGAGRQFVFVVDGNTLEFSEARQVSRAASGFFSRLTRFDRSALVSLPIGAGVPFTWAHEQVREALLRVSASAGTGMTWEYGSLSEARDIVKRGAFALREVAFRECPGSVRASGGGFGGPAPTSPGGAGGQSSPPSTGDSGSGSSGQSSGSGGSQPRPSGQSGGDWFGSDQCSREIRAQAEMAWSMARANSLSSMTAVRLLLERLARVQGDKVMILISGGWPLDEADEMSNVRTLAADAAAARVTIFSLFVPRSSVSASLRSISHVPLSDQNLYYWALENVAAVTGGQSFKADAGPEGIFDRLSRELSGYYRLGVERHASDDGTKARRMNVQVKRSGASVRARHIFDVKTYEDRDWAARLASALESPGPATAVGLRVTSYVSSDPEDPAHLRLVLTGEASRMQPGDATLQLLVRDLGGREIGAGEQRIPAPEGTETRFATSVRVPPGTYVVRLAVQDGAGRVGSVDHWAEAKPVSFGDVSVTGPLLVRVPATGQGEPQFTLDGVATDQRLALEVGLLGNADDIAGADVTFQIAAGADGPPLIERPARVSPAKSPNSVLAHAVTDVRVLPPGRYVVRAKVTAGGEVIGEVRRGFDVIGRSPEASVVGTAGTAATVATAAPSIRGRAAAAAPAFAVNRVLSADVLGAFLDRVAARPDASSPAASDLLTRARTGSISDLNVSDAQAAQAPIASFIKGLALLSQNKVSAAAQAFRAAMRASPDFYPAMVYLGACYAAAGNDKEAAAIWRTALIREGDTRILHLLLADALLRQGNDGLALQVITTASARWPEEDELKRRFVIAALGAGNTSAGLQALDELIERQAHDEGSLALGILALYETLTNGRTVESVEQDRARMMRLADAYRARGGPSAGLVEAWVAAVKQR